MQQPEITFVVAYRCPNCQAALEARSSEAQQGWLRCPKCGRASLPPELERTSRVDPGLASAAMGDDILVIGPGIEDSGKEPSAGDAARAYPAGAVLRVAFLLAVLVAISGLFMAFRRGSLVSVAIYGLVVLVLFAVAGTMTRRR